MEHSPTRQGVQRMMVAHTWKQVIVARRSERTVACDQPELEHDAVAGGRPPTVERSGCIVASTDP
jgi:hypothetical protein